MAKEYIPTKWVNGTTPAINATNLNHIEEGIVNVTNEVNLIREEIDSGAIFKCNYATKNKKGCIRIQVIDNGDGTHTGRIWTQD